MTSIVALTLNPAIDKNTRVEHVRSPTVPIESRVGAGDSMVGGLPLALARGRSLGRPFGSGSPPTRPPS